MANPNIPNLCGANPNLNESLSKIEELKDKLLSNIDVDASTLKSELEEGLDELTSAFDKLEAKLPEAPAVNFQAEVTSLINDINKTTAAGIGAFNTKLASLKLDFGNTLEEKGIDFDSLIASAETKLAGGGNVCDLVSNLEIPAGNSGTGITTETKEERGTGTSITLTDTPKSIVSVFGKRSGEGFFGSANYKQSGRTITTTESFEIIRVRYVIDLIKEKPIAVKQADKDGEKEELSIVSKNLKSVEKNAEAKVQALSKQINDRTAAGVSTDDVQKQFDTLIATLESEEFKTQMNNDFAAAKSEYNKIAQDPLKYKTITVPQGNTSSVSSTSDEAAVVQEEKKVRKVRATTTEDRNTVTQEQTTITISGGEEVTITAPKTEKTVISENGFTSRKNYVSESFINFIDIEELTKIRKIFGTSKYQIVDRISSGIELKQTPLTIESVAGRSYFPNRASFSYDVLDDSDKNNITPVIQDDTKKVIFVPRPNRKNKNVSVRDIQVLKITYTVLEKIDPNFKG